MMIPIAQPLIGEEEKRAVLDVLNSGQLASGKEVDKFEQAFGDFIGTKYAVAASNGTTALHAALLAHGLKTGDEVITTPFTFIATANAIRMTGARPVFVDIEENTFNIDPELLEAAITEKTKAILPVHLFGQPCQMDRIQEIAQKHNLIIIEDACQAHGAEFQGKKIGSSNTACFSFYPTKNMTTGEGGMITTNDSAIAKKIRKIINHGAAKRYYHQFLGYNYRMTNISAAIGIAQLKKLPNFNQKRQDNARILTENLSLIPGIIAPKTEPGHVFHQYAIRIMPEFKLTREELQNYLFKRGIDSTIFYPLPIHQQEAYQEHSTQSFPAAEKLSKDILSIPVHPSLSFNDLNFIINAFNDLK